MVLHANEYELQQQSIYETKYITFDNEFTYFLQTRQPFSEERIEQEQCPEKFEVQQREHEDIYDYQVIEG